MGFYSMYPEAQIPKEFLSVFKKEEKYPSNLAFYPSILLTQAYKNGYTIKAVTNNYVILFKYTQEDTIDKK